MTSQSKRYAETSRIGALGAALEYSRMSNGGNLWRSGIETFVSAKVAEHIFLKHARSVKLEYMASDLLREYGKKLDWRYKRYFNEDSVFDIALMGKKNSKPIGLIEIKKRFTLSKMENDIRRMCDILKTFSKEDVDIVRFSLCIAIEGFIESSNKNTSRESGKIVGFVEEEYKDLKVSVEHTEKKGNFGLNSDGKKYIGVRAYSIELTR